VLIAVHRDDGRVCDYHKNITAWFKQ